MMEARESDLEAHKRVVSVISPLGIAGRLMGIGFTDVLTGRVVIDYEKNRVIDFTPGGDQDTITVNGEQMTYEYFGSYVESEVIRYEREDAEAAQLAPDPDVVPPEPEPIIDGPISAPLDVEPETEPEAEPTDGAE